MFPPLNLEIRPVSEQRFTTLGDWWQREDGSYTITVSEMDDWRHVFLVLAHELTEWAITRHQGVTSAECDAFDSMFEEEIRAGRWGVEIEAGFDRRCPYRKGHVWGCRAERLFSWLLGVNWNDYCQACIRLLETYESK
jgi:hypothetical protein